MRPILAEGVLAVLLPKDTQDIIDSEEMRKNGFRRLLPGEAAQELARLE